LLSSIIRVLQVLATISLRTRARCLRYINHQICLINNIAQAVSRKSAADKQTTREFRSFKEHYLKFKTQLPDMDPSREESSLNEVKQNWVDKVHIYLGA
jgi:soluble cytochrome b562